MGLIHLAGLGDKEKWTSPNRGCMLGPGLKLNGSSLLLWQARPEGAEEEAGCLAFRGQVPMATSACSNARVESQGLQGREACGRTGHGTEPQFPHMPHGVIVCVTFHINNGNIKRAGVHRAHVCVSVASTQEPAHCYPIVS